MSNLTSLTLYIIEVSSTPSPFGEGAAEISTLKLMVG